MRIDSLLTQRDKLEEILSLYENAAVNSQVTRMIVTGEYLNRLVKEELFDKDSTYDVNNVNYLEKLSIVLL